MEVMRGLGQAGLAIGLLALSAGGLTVFAAVVMAGDWWLAREPLIGLGLDLVLLGLALTAACRCRY